ncbi:matrixin family metalloprotease [Roseibium sp. M-1]
MKLKAGFIFLISAVLSFGFYSSAFADGAGFAPLKLDGNLVKWGKAELGTPAQVTYAFVQEPTVLQQARNCKSMDSLARLARINHLSMDAIREQVGLAFRLWEDVSGLSFREVQDTAGADILLGTQSVPRGFAFTNVRSQPEPADGAEVHDVADRGLSKPERQPVDRGGITGALKLARITQSAICLNPVHKWKIGFDGDLGAYDLRYTFAHEIGHAIGLDHYVRESSIMHFKYRENFRGLQPSDIEGVQWLYGSRMD